MLSSLILDSNKKVNRWISTGITSEKTKPLDVNLESTMSNLANSRISLKFNNFVLAQKSFSSLYSNFILNLYIVFELNNWPLNPTNDFSLKNFIWYSQISKKSNGKFIYNGWARAFDGEGSWSFANDFARNVVISGVDNSSSSLTDNQKYNFLVLGKGSTDGINNTTGAAEKKRVTWWELLVCKKTNIWKFKANNSISWYDFCLGGKLKDFTKDE